MPDLPTTVGLCPGRHTGDFYMPDPGENECCSFCDEPFAVYVRADEVREALDAAMSFAPVEKPELGGDPDWLAEAKAKVRNLRATVSRPA